MTVNTAKADVLHEAQTGPMAWDANSALPDDGKFLLSAECRLELDNAAQFLVENPLPTTLVQDADFALEHCRAACRSIRKQLDDEIGFVIIERLPVERYDYDITVKLYWLLMSMIGTPVAQKWNGEMIYDVTDTGRKSTAGSGIRSSKTNGGQLYHTDNSFNLPPHFVGLLCLHPAAQGGESGLISFDCVYNRLLKKHPDVVARLYEPFYFDRQREHSPDESPYRQAPVFEVHDGKLHTRLATKLIRDGYVVAEKELDPDGARALQALDEVMEASGLGKTFDFEPGQIQIVNNRRLGHRRTAFVDSDDPARKRHLVRIWLRDEGRAHYHG